MDETSDMLVSVIIPTRNRAGLIGRALGSVLGQTHAALDVLVVDDASTDETLTRLDAFDDPRLRVLSHAVPRGVSAARNTGLAAARGEVMALLDSDDEWLPTKIERLLAFARRQGHVICQNQEIWMRGGRRVNPGQAHEKRDGWFFEQALARCLVSPSSVLWTRRFLDTVGGFDETLPACEDYDLWLRALLHYPIGLCNEWLTIRHGGRADQLSASMVGMDLFRIRAMLGLFGRPGLTAWHRDCIKKELGRKVAVYVRGCLKNDRPQEAERVLELVAPVGIAAEPCGPGGDA